ncbi:MAG TPA: low affinity iron permease family protein, partial [Pyrinomonadaceae bacterium]
LDELIKATSGARNDVIDLDKLSDEQLKQLEEEYKHICANSGGPSDHERSVMDDVKEEKGARQG